MMRSQTRPELLGISGWRKYYGVQIEDSLSSILRKALIAVTTMYISLPYLSPECAPKSTPITQPISLIPLCCRKQNMFFG
jgi:hypothetical protein